VPRISPHLQEFVLVDGVIQCAGCGAKLINSGIEHQPGCEAVCKGHHVNDPGDAADWDIEVTLDLAELGLRHSKAGCRCGGKHEVSIGIQPVRHGFLPLDEVPGYAGFTDEVIQALHEQAHPDGTIYAESCRERGCLQAAEG
jgi:hypothetical protein